MSVIGLNIKRLRKLNKMNQNEFAKKIGVSQGSLSDIESGKSKPAVDTVISIYDNFQCSLEWLLTGKEKNSSFELSTIEERLLTIVKVLNERDKEELLEIAYMKKNRSEINLK